MTNNISSPEQFCKYVCMLQQYYCNFIWLFYFVKLFLNRFLMKLFNTNNMQIIELCCEQFNFVFPSRQIANRRDKFIKSDSQRNNLLTFVTM